MFKKWAKRLTVVGVVGGLVGWMWVRRTTATLDKLDQDLSADLG